MLNFFHPNPCIDAHHDAVGLDAQREVDENVHVQGEAVAADANDLRHRVRPIRRLVVIAQRQLRTSTRGKGYAFNIHQSQYHATLASPDPQQT